MPNLEIFEGKSITWILLMFFGIAAAALWKSGKDFIKNFFVKYEEIVNKTEKILQENRKEAEKREQQLKRELQLEREKSEAKEKDFIKQLSENTKATNKIVIVLDDMKKGFNNKLDDLNAKVDSVIKNK
jgi:dynactin complex subunit